MPRAIASTRGRLEVGEGVVVEHDLLHFGHVLLDPVHFGEHVLGRTHAVAVAADRLRPQAEGALRAAAAAGVEAHVRMLQIADEVVLDLQVALVDRRDERQLVHVLEDRARQVVHDAAVGIAIGQALDVSAAAALGDFLAGVVEFLAADEIDRRRSPSASRPGRPWSWRRPCRSGRCGLSCFSSSANCASVGNDGVLVCMMTRS